MSRTGSQLAGCMLAAPVVEQQQSSGENIWKFHDGIQHRVRSAAEGGFVTEERRNSPEMDAPEEERRKLEMGDRRSRENK